MPILYEALCDVRKSDTADRNYEFIFVNDGSRDKTADIIRDLAANDKGVKYIFFFCVDTRFPTCKHANLTILRFNFFHFP